MRSTPVRRIIRATTLSGAAGTGGDGTASRARHRASVTPTWAERSAAGDKAAPLRYVWLITTKDSLPYCTCIEAFLNKFIPSAQICGRDGMNGICHLAEGGDLELIERTKSILSSIYSQTYLEDFGLTKSDIVVDITGGTKSITIGLIFGALDSVIDIQYVEQQSKRYAVVPLAITLEIILDKAGEYLINLYSKMYEGRKE